MNDTKSYGRGTVIFREGDRGNCMYEVQGGSVGIYRDYGGPNEVQIASVYSGKTFGEMGLLDHAPRSATAVAMEENTILTAITEEEFNSYFTEKPHLILDLLQQMCNRLRQTTKDYVEACHTAHDAVEAYKNDLNKNQALLDRIDKLCEYYSSQGSNPYI